jgi:hypothetical protein
MHNDLNKVLSVKVPKGRDSGARVLLTPSGRISFHFAALVGEFSLAGGFLLAAAWWFAGRHSSAQGAAGDSLLADLGVGLILGVATTVALLFAAGSILYGYALLRRRWRPSVQKIAKSTPYG